MPHISFLKNNHAPLQVEKGAGLMQSLLLAGLPVASSCHGDGVCAKCRMQIVDGAENLSKPNEAELFLIEKFQLEKNIRISCQAEVLGDVTIHASYW